MIDDNEARQEMCEGKVINCPKETSIPMRWFHGFDASTTEPQVRSTMQPLLIKTHLTNTDVLTHQQIES